MIAPQSWLQAERDKQDTRDEEMPQQPPNHEEEEEPRLRPVWSPLLIWNGRTLEASFEHRPFLFSALESKIKSRASLWCYLPEIKGMATFSLVTQALTCREEVTILKLILSRISVIELGKSNLLERICLHGHVCLLKGEGWYGVLVCYLQLCCACKSALLFPSAPEWSAQWKAARLCWVWCCSCYATLVISVAEHKIGKQTSLE